MKVLSKNLSIWSYFFTRQRLSILCLLWLNNFSVEAFDMPLREQTMSTFNFSTIKNESVSMIDFTQSNEVKNWQATNDGVMGGMSQGKMLFQDNSCTFSGEISLENNGGFSSVNRSIEQLPKGLNTVEIDIEGDGLTYQLRMTIVTNGYRLAYKHDFLTSKGKREKIMFSLSDFKASFRGRLVQGAPELKSENIREIGFLISNKQQGPFALDIFQLTMYHHQNIGNKA